MGLAVGEALLKDEGRGGAGDSPLPALVFSQDLQDRQDTGAQGNDNHIQHFLGTLAEISARLKRPGGEEGEGGERGWPRKGAKGGSRG